MMNFGWHKAGNFTLYKIQIVLKIQTVFLSKGLISPGQISEMGDQWYGELVRRGTSEMWDYRHYPVEIYE